MAATFNPATATGGIVLSNANKTATATGSAGDIYGTDSLTGKIYWAVQVSIGASSNYIGVAVGGVYAGWQSDGTVWESNTSQGAGPAGFSSGWMLFALDGPNRKLWMHNGTQWLGRSTSGGYSSDSPITGTGGTGVDVGTPVIRYYQSNSGDVATVDGAALDSSMSSLVTSLQGAGFSALSGGTLYTLTASAGSFAFTGVAANLKYNRCLTASAGSFALTPGADRLTHNGLLFVLGTTANATNLLYNRRLVASAGNFSFTGNPTTLTYTRTLTAQAGSFAFTGVDALLTYSPLVGWIKKFPTATTWTTQ